MYPKFNIGGQFLFVTGLDFEIVINLSKVETIESDDNRNTIDIQVGGVSKKYDAKNPSAERDKIIIRITEL